MVNWNIINRTVRKNIITYITRHHPCVVVASIEQENDIYKINLLNGESLVFHADGNYIKNIF